MNAADYSTNRALTQTKSIQNPSLAENPKPKALYWEKGKPHSFETGRPTNFLTGVKQFGAKAG